jgi:hypothetical protein
MFQLEILIFKLLSVNRLATSAVVIGEIAALAHLVVVTAVQQCQAATIYRLTNLGIIRWKIEPL